MRSLIQLRSSNYNYSAELCKFGSHTSKNLYSKLNFLIDCGTCSNHLSIVWKKNFWKSITHNIFKVQSDVTISCGFILCHFHRIYAGKTFLDYVNIFSPNGYRYSWPPNEYKYFKEIYSKKTVSLYFRLKTINETRNYLLDILNKS